MYGMQKLLLQPGKDVPPDDVVALALPLFDAVIRAAQIVQRQHAVFSLYVLQYLLPVVVVVQLGRDDIVGEDKAFLHPVDRIAYRHVGMP